MEDFERDLEGDLGGDLEGDLFYIYSYLNLFKI